MKAICVLYQVTNNIIKEKLDKEGKKLGAVTMVERTVTKELYEKYPELKKAKVPLGAKIPLPEKADPANLVKVTEFDIEAKFVFPKHEFVGNPEEEEKAWLNKITEDAKDLDDKEDYEK